MLKKLLFAFILAILTPLAFGQKMHIAGVVQDSSGMALPNALATAVRVKDSLLLEFARADKDGKFVLDNIEMDTFMLTVSHPRFDDRSFYIVGSPSNLEIDIPSIKMATKSKQFDDLVIYAYKDPIHFKGDTLVYIADSFKTGPNAVVEDLLKKLPGIEVDSDGKIKSQGQEIKKVLVDGDEFFGSDPTIATKNLGAKAIETVEVYEKEDDGEFGSDNKIKVLDLKLKDDAKKGYFGKVSGASDFGIADKKKPFYEGEFLFNHYKSTQKISVFGLGTNTPRSNFGWGDANKFGLENEDVSGSPFGNPFENTSPNGIPKTWKAGIYFTDKVGKKKNTKIGFNYTYYNKELQAYSGSRTQYFLTDTTYFTDDSTNNLTRSQSHIINFNVESQLDSLTKLTIKPSFRVDQQLTDNNTLTQYLAEDNTSTLQTFANNKNKSLGLDGDLTAKLNRRFKKPKRELELDYYFNYIDNKTKGSILTRTEFPLFPAVNDTTDQSKINYNSTMVNNAFASYTEPFGKYLKGTIMYNYRNELLKQNRETNNFVNGSYSDLDSTLSNQFETKRNEHKAGFKLQFDKDKHMAFVRVDVRNVDINNVNLFTNNSIHQNISNVLPSVRYQYRASMSKQLRITYSTNSEQASITDLQPVPDNSNPNRIKVGNPNLRPNYSHELNAWFNSWNPMNSGFIWAGMNASYTNNDFATSTTYDAFGRMNIQTVNVDGNFNSNIYGGGGIPLKGRTIQLHPNLLAGYSHFTNFINNQKNVTDNWLLGGGGEFKFRWDSLEFNFGGRYDWNSPKSSLNSASSTPYGVQNYTFSIDWRLPLGFQIKTDARYTRNDRLSQGYSLNYFIWNASVSKNFLKTQNLNLAIEANDILNQSVNAGRSVSGNMITDNRTKIITRYFLLRLTYRFNNFKTSEHEEKFPF